MEGGGVDVVKWCSYSELSPGRLRTTKADKTILQWQQGDGLVAPIPLAQAAVDLSPPDQAIANLLKLESLVLLPSFK